MATAAFRRQATGSTADAGAVRAASHPKMEIVPEGGDPFVVPYAPRETTTAGFTPAFQTVDRGGRRPLVLEGGQGLPVMSFDLIVARFDPNQAIEGILHNLQELAESGARMTVRLDKTSARYRWRLTQFSQQVTSRQHGSNYATRALCSLEFTVASDPATLTGPASGGAKSGNCGDRPKFYTFKAGDKLSEIAKRFYCDTAKWRAIADANDIRDVQRIKVGTRLRLP